MAATPIVFKIENLTFWGETSIKTWIEETHTCKKYSSYYIANWAAVKTSNFHWIGGCRKVSNLRRIRVHLGHRKRNNFHLNHRVFWPSKRWILLPDLFAKVRANSLKSSPSQNLQFRRFISGLPMVSPWGLEALRARLTASGGTDGQEFQINEVEADSLSQESIFVDVLPNPWFAIDVGIQSAMVE